MAARRRGPSACRRGAPHPCIPTSRTSYWGAGPQPVEALGPRLTWLGLHQRVCLPRRGAGSGAQRIVQRPGAASSSLELGRTVQPQAGLTRRLRAAGVAAAPLRAIPQDVLDEEGGKRLGLGGRQGPGTVAYRLRLPRPRLGSPEHPGGLAPTRCSRTTFAFRHPRALIAPGSAPRRLPIGRGDSAPPLIGCAALQVTRRGRRAFRTVQLRSALEESFPRVLFSIPGAPPAALSRFLRLGAKPKVVSSAAHNRR
jgi:hypothetical protein